MCKYISEADTCSMENQNNCVMLYCYSLLRRHPEPAKDRGGASNHSFEHSFAIQKLANQNKVGWGKDGLKHKKKAQTSLFSLKCIWMYVLALYQLEIYYLYYLV